MLHDESHLSNHNLGSTQSITTKLVFCARGWLETERRDYQRATPIDRVGWAVLANPTASMRDTDGIEILVYYVKPYQRETGAPIQLSFDIDGYSTQDQRANAERSSLTVLLWVDDCLVFTSIAELVRTSNIVRELPKGTDWKGPAWMRRGSRCLWIYSSDSPSCTEWLRSRTLQGDCVEAVLSDRLHAMALDPIGDNIRQPWGVIYDRLCP